tara:strand:+ start:243 stop:809 length:567 start_codon:yes stop_codon:yes gene_type:complete
MLNKKIQEHCNTIKDIKYLEKDINRVINKITALMKKGGKILFCGNGGSAADAQHLAAEFLVRLRPNLNRRPLPALSLAADTSTITACGNDYGFENIFSRVFNAISLKNDILFVISTSGNSKNIIKVLKDSKKKKIYSVGFLGKGGGAAKKYCKDKIIIKSNNTANIQEAHIFLGQYLLEEIEKKIIIK